MCWLLQLLLLIAVAEDTCTKHSWDWYWNRFAPVDRSFYLRLRSLKLPSHRRRIWIANQPIMRQFNRNCPQKTFTQVKKQQLLKLMNLFCSNLISSAVFAQAAACCGTFCFRWIRLQQRLTPTYPDKDMWVVLDPLMASLHWKYEYTENDGAYVGRIHPCITYSCRTEQMFPSLE